jgi:hypothetical protein
VLICLKNRTEIVKQEHRDMIFSVEKFVADNDLSVAEFATSWDIGIDTIDTMHMRPESWWLWGISHLTVVPRPSDSANIAAGFECIFAQGFGVKGRKVPFDRSDYSRMLEGASTRKGWV